MRTVLAAMFSLMFALTTVIAQAQPIQGHPQKEAYGSPAEYIAVDNQCWFDDPDPLKAGHVHVVPRPPLYTRVTDWGTTFVPFTLKLHNASGKVGVVGEHVRSVRWDNPSLPIQGGGPNSLVELTGVAEIDHTLNPVTFPPDLFQFPVHGWADDRIEAVLALDDGRRLDTYAEWPVYSVIDPSAPIKPAPEQGNPGVHLRTRCVMWSADPAQTAGEVFTEIADYVPLGPVFAPWNTIANMYNYTAPAGLTFAPEVFQIRKDADLHHGVIGTLLRQLVIGPAMNKQFIGPITLDPADFGSGAHKAMVVWTQPLPTVAPSSLSSVIVIPFTVGVGVPPPTLCTDPAANNTGKPLPCTYDPPPVLLCQDPLATNNGGPLPCIYPHVPVVTWQAEPLFLEQKFIDGVAQPVFKFCVSGDCYILQSTLIPK